MPVINVAERDKISPVNSYGRILMRLMVIYCPVCDARAVIKKTARKHKELSDLYCACTDVECGHTFVMNVTFSHTLSPSAKPGETKIGTIFKSLNIQQQEQLLKLLSQIGFKNSVSCEKQLSSVTK